MHFLLADNQQLRTIIFSFGKKARLFVKFCHNGNHRQSRKTLTQKPKKIMSDIQKEISILREILEDSVLTPAERQTIWAQIAQLEALAS